MNLNLYSIANIAITSIVDNQSIIIALPVISQDANFNMITNYTQINTTAQIQLADNQKLEHKDYYQHNGIYKTFFLNSTNLTGLNRNLGTNGDYVIWNNLYYRIVEVIDNFQTGWVQIVGCESTDFVSG